MDNKQYASFLKQREWDIKHRLSDLENALRQVDIGNNACFSSQDSRESIRKRLSLILAEFVLADFEEKS
jgi:hypothetical protein